MVVMMLLLLLFASTGTSTGRGATFDGDEIGENTIGCVAGKDLLVVDDLLFDFADRRVVRGEEELVFGAVAIESVLEIFETRHVGDVEFGEVRRILIVDVVEDFDFCAGRCRRRWLFDGRCTRVFTHGRVAVINKLICYACRSTITM